MRLTLWVSLGDRYQRYQVDFITHPTKDELFNGHRVTWDVPNDGNRRVVTHAFLYKEEHAQTWDAAIGLVNPFHEGVADALRCEIGSLAIDGQMAKFLSLTDPQPQLLAPTKAVNNHTCPTCKNTKCSRTERLCWLCGNKL
ncbi:hypothetical protein [Acidithiobacillus sp.]|uniref:hypothetical protein n=1 Tax=Acidithiobacillus sp. TaxID=1872118 RepID=UPI00258CC18C|nr:hypothetical protein [Acidithiobacillus sp.]MDD5374454.1 hypothetical protein [Acidithiobacillus sp.]